MSEIEIYDPFAIGGSDLKEDSMFHNPEVVADKIGEVKHKKDKPKKKKPEPKKEEPVITWQEEAEEALAEVELPVEDDGFGI